MLEDIEYLKKYPYGCNEQTASRLSALLLEAQVKVHLKEPVQNKKAILKSMKRLQSTQNSDGGWGWWKKGKSSGWITAYVLKTLKMAETQGYSTMLRTTGDDIIRYLVNNFYSFDKSSQMYILQVLIDLEMNIDGKKMLAAIFQKIGEPTFSEQLAIAKVQLYEEHIYSLDTIYSLATILQTMKTTTFGGYYWGEEGYRFFDNSIHLTIQAYDVFKKAGREDICKGIRRFFLEKEHTRAGAILLKVHRF